MSEIFAVDSCNDAAVTAVSSALAHVNLSKPDPSTATSNSSMTSAHEKTKAQSFDPREVCREFMYQRCKSTTCTRLHDKQLCFYYWKNGVCRNGDACNKKHTIMQSKQTLSSMSVSANKENTDTTTLTTKPIKSLPSKPSKYIQKRVKNTECFEPMTRAVDMRVVLDLATDRFTATLTAHDVVLVPNAFSDFKTGEIYSRLSEEISQCGIPEDRLLKLWHGNAEIEGTHLIADDKTRWKEHCPTFALVVNRLKAFFSMEVKATRLNWYKDTSQWKPFHHDAAAVKADVAKTQNFTVAISFGTTRDAAFEHASTKAVISMPVSDGCIYAFTNQTNVTWRHGILQDTPSREEGRISVIAWGWIDGLNSDE